MRIPVTRLACLLLMTAVLSPAQAGRPAATKKQDKTLVTFFAMGDVPYAPKEDKLLPKQIADLTREAEFVIHVGDIKSGATECNEAVYTKVSGMLARSKAPVFIVPGDNEWNDCTKPAQAWKYWEKYFMRFDRRWRSAI